MRIKSAEFAGAVAQPGGPVPGELPEVAFAGRSNVGKSSLINRLLGRTRSKLARVSSSPGKTREINFYDVRAATAQRGDLAFFLVDLPGYGYARVPAGVRGDWKPLIESYVEQSPRLLGVVHLIDARHDPTDDDVQMVEYLVSQSLPTLFALTKFDKLKRSQRVKRLRRTVERLDVDDDQVIPFSAVTGEGRDELLDSMEGLLTR